MYKRFKDAISAPTNLLKYQNDKWYITLFYFLIIICLSLIPSLVKLGSTTQLDSEDESILREAFKMVDLPFIINEDLKLETTSDEKDFTVVNTISVNLEIVITVNPEYDVKLSDKKVILIAYDGIYSYDIGVMKVANYEDYESLKGLDFIGATNNDKAFWDIVFDVVNSVFEKDSLKFNLIDISKQAFSMMLIQIVLALMLTFFQGGFIRQNLRFGRRLQLVIYLLFPYAIGMLFTELFGLSIFFIIGLFITLIYNMRISAVFIKEDKDEL